MPSPGLRFHRTGLDFQEAGARVHRVVEHAAEFEAATFFQADVVGFDRKQHFIVAFLFYGEELATVVYPLDLLEHQYDVFGFFSRPMSWARLASSQIWVLHLLASEGQRSRL